MRVSDDCESPPIAGGGIVGIHARDGPRKRVVVSIVSFPIS